MTGLPDFDIDRGTLLGAAAGAITAFRLRGRTSHEENVALAKILLDKHRIFTVHRDGLASGSCISCDPGFGHADGRLR
jgi:hypothetical protein